MSNSLFKILYGMYHTKIPLILWSNPGRGKTSSIKNLAKILGVTLEIRSGNKSDLVDFSGLPYTVDTGNGDKEVRYSKPKYVKSLENNPDGILFLDEMGTCHASLLAAFLSVFQDCEFGEFSIPKTIFRVAASNYTNITGNNRPSLAMTNRCVNIFIKSNVERYCQGIVSGFSDYEYPIINGETEKQSKYIQYAISAADFLLKNPQYLPEDIPDIDEPTDVAYPSERSWENAIKLLSVLDRNDGDYIKELLDGTVGIEASKMFRRFLKENNSTINLFDYIGKESTLQITESVKHDEIMHYMESITALLKQDSKKFIKLFCRIVNILHNKDKQYGDYPGYNGFINKYFLRCIEYIDEAQYLSKELILKFHGIIKSDYKIDDFSRLYTLAYDGRLNSDS